MALDLGASRASSARGKSTALRTHIIAQEAYRTWRYHFRNLGVLTIERVEYIVLDDALRNRLPNKAERQG